VIETVLAAWRNSHVSHVVVVVHPDDERLAELCRSSGAIVVVPAAAPPDMKASVRLGLEYVADHFDPQLNDVWLVAPADMPLLSSAAIDAVLTAHSPARPEIVVPSHSGRRGHPVLFPWNLASEVQQLADDEGLKHLVGRHAARELDWPEPSILADMDTPEEYRRLLGRESSR